eukprot:Skav221095  [mRNA]  locus=scaffold4552:98960:105434:- [translate_table: standard]
MLGSSARPVSFHIERIRSATRGAGIREETSVSLWRSSAAISTCGKSSEWTEAIAILQELIEVKLELDVVPFSAAINACAKGQEWLPALLILSELNTVQVEVNVITYNSAINASAGEWQIALALLHAMLENQLQETSRWLFRDLRTRQLEANLITYNSAISACAKKGEWQKALELLAELDVLRACDVAWAASR